MPRLKLGLNYLFRIFAGLCIGSYLGFISLIPFTALFDVFGIRSRWAYEPGFPSISHAAVAFGVVVALVAVVLLCWPLFRRVAPAGLAILLAVAIWPPGALAGNHAGQPRWFEPLTGQSNDYSTVSASISAEFSSATRYVEVVCTTACFIQIALSPAVAKAITDQSGAGRFYLPADTPRIVQPPGCSGGICGVIAAIRLSSDGTVYVTELGIGTP